MNQPTDDARLDAALRAYAGELPELPAALDDTVMAAVRRRARPAPAPARGLWHRLMTPRTVRVRPVWIPALAAAAIAAWLILPRAPRTTHLVPTVASAPDTVFVHFELTAPEARAVAVAGSFNGWRADALPMARNAAGVWSVTVPLPLGEHRYQFVVNGERWVADPGAPAQADDGFGGSNSVIVVGPKGLVRA